MNGNMKNIIKQAQKMQKKMVEIQEQLADERVTGSAGGGMVTVVADGQQNVLEVSIKPEVVDPEEVEMLQDLIVAATAEALRLSRELSEKKMGSVTGGMGIPGM